MTCDSLHVSLLHCNCHVSGFPRRENDAGAAGLLAQVKSYAQNTAKVVEDDDLRRVLEFDQRQQFGVFAKEMASIAKPS